MACICFALASQAAENSAGVPAGSFLQAFLALAFIVALLVALAWMARKVTGGKGFGQGGMKIVGGVALGPRERIVLVEVGDTWLVVGVVPGQIRTLHTLSRATVTSGGEDVTAEGPLFAQWLKQITEKKRID